MPIERIAWDVKAHIVRQADRQVFFFLRHRTAGLAMHHGDRTAPISLAAEAPIPEAKFNLAFAQTFIFEPIDGLFDAVLDRCFTKPGKMIDINNLFGLDGHQRHILNLGVIARHMEGRPHLEPIFSSKIKVALVMGRAGIDSARAVIHQDKVADPNRHLPIRPDRVTDGDAGIDALFLSLFHRRFGGVHLVAFNDEIG